jgi:hypothetical protein
MILKKIFNSNREDSEIIERIGKGKYVCYAIGNEKHLLKSIRVIDSTRGIDSLLCMNYGTLGISTYINHNYYQNTIYKDILIKADKEIWYSDERIIVFSSVANNVNVIMSMWLKKEYNILDRFKPNSKGTAYMLEDPSEYEYLKANYQECLKAMLELDRIGVVA